MTIQESDGSNIKTDDIMAKKTKLYIKNEKGRFEEYKPELKIEDSNLFFRKQGNKYVPCGRTGHLERLGEGVWVVLSNLSYCSKEVFSGDYLKELFQIRKVSGIEDVSIAQLGSLQKYADYVRHEWNEYHRNYMLGHEYSLSNDEVIHFIIGKVFEYNQKLMAEKKEVKP